MASSSNASADPADPTHLTSVKLSYRQIARIIWRRVSQNPTVGVMILIVLAVSLISLYVIGCRWYLINQGGLNPQHEDFIPLLLLMCLLIVPGIVLVGCVAVILLVAFICHCFDCCGELYHEIDHDIHEKVARSV